jgi:hypothetical protein
MSVVIKHCGFIQGRRVEASDEYIVHSDALGVVAQCATLDSARDALDLAEKKYKERGTEPHLAIFEWSAHRWCASMSLYELMEFELRKDPARRIDPA